MTSPKRSASSSSHPTGLWHVARLAWRTVPYAFARSGRDAPGPVAFELRAPSGEDWEFVPDDRAEHRHPR